MAKIVRVVLDVAGHGPFSARFDAEKAGRQWSQLSDAKGVRVAGVHMYVTAHRGGLIRCDMRVSNGSVLPDGTGFCGKLYFAALNVSSATPGTEIVALPRYGELTKGGLYEVIRPLPSGQHHVMLPRAAFLRSFVIAPTGQRSKALAILNRDALVISAQIDSFGPLNVRFPKIDRALADSRARSLAGAVRAAVQDGTKCWQQDMTDLQPALPGCYLRLDGEGSAGAPGGYGIELSQADCQTRWNLVWREQLAQLVMESRNYSCYNAQTGEVVRCGDWTTPMHERNRAGDGRLVMPWTIDGDMRTIVFNAQYEGTCPYETQLAAIEPHDVAHLVRAYRHLVPVIAITGEQVYRDELESVYEFARTGEWSNRPDEKVTPDYPGQWVFPSLRKKLADANAKPHVGSWLERSYGDFMWITGAMLKWRPGRTDIAADADALHDLAILAADPFGITVCAWKGASPEYFPNPDDAGYQCFHVGRVCNGLLALCIQRYGGCTSEALDLLVRAYQTTNETFPIRDLGNAKSPPKWVSTERAGVHHTSLSQSYVSIEGDPVPWFPLHMGAMLYRETGDAKYMALALRYFFPHANQADRLAWCRGEKYKGLIGDYEGVLEKYLEP